ncbi:hypothetical protein [Fibrobacter intestinalis]|uniref:hypothetical protein n=1 Tax=Fibrobacter intestinalis TaxID=28122 RepID=UPI00135659F9|nr:hypothetical protein [Fibrobacter intestinalis]
MIHVKDLPDWRVCRNVFHSILPNVKRNISLPFGDWITAISQKENTRRPRHTIRPRQNGARMRPDGSTLLFFWVEMVEIPCQEQEQLVGISLAPAFLAHQIKKAVS